MPPKPCDFPEKPSRGKANTVSHPSACTRQVSSSTQEAEERIYTLTTHCRQLHLRCLIKGRQRRRTTGCPSVVWIGHLLFPSLHLWGDSAFIFIIIIIITVTTLLLSMPREQRSNSSKCPDAEDIQKNLSHKQVVSSPRQR